MLVMHTHTSEAFFTALMCIHETVKRSYSCFQMWLQEARTLEPTGIFCRKKRLQALANSGNIGEPTMPFDRYSGPNFPEKLSRM